MDLFLSAIDSPWGTLAFSWNAAGVTGLDLGSALDAFAQSERRRFPQHTLREEQNPKVAQRLVAYARGDLSAIDDLEVDLLGTAFQRRVWSELRRIGPGRTISYAELARRVGQPTAVRAVGGANGRNPVPLIVPCHRVIASDGTLGGYSAGLPLKQKLLAHEAAFASRPAA